MRGMTSAGPLKVTLMTRHKQEREGPPLPRREHSLHHKEGGRREVVPQERSLAIVPPPLSPCQRSLPRTRTHAISVHFTSDQQGKQTGATSVSKEAVVFAVRVRNLLVGESQHHRHPSPSSVPSNTATRNLHSRTLTLFLKLTVSLPPPPPPKTQTQNTSTHSSRELLDVKVWFSNALLKPSQQMQIFSKRITAFQMNLI